MSVTNHPASSTGGHCLRSKRVLSGWRGLCAVGLSGLSLSACAAPNPVDGHGGRLALQTPTVGRTADAQDPLEGFNRKVFAVNQALDRYFLKPVAQGYRAVVPDPVQSRVHNLLLNLDEPGVFVNQVLQGQVSYAGMTLLRFATNTTWGLGGLNDFATPFGFTAHSGDFGQTLATWGIDSGPYLYLPLFGPSTVRDGAGLVVDIEASPWGYLTPSSLVWTGYAHTGLNALDARSRALDQLDAIERSSIDMYASLRSLYLQYRDAEVRRIKASGPDSAPINGDEFDMPPPAKKS